MRRRKLRPSKMGKEELPKRKHPRLDNFDYNSNGAYFITICSQNRRCVFSRIVGQSTDIVGQTSDIVGRGLAPAENCIIEYTQYGKIAEEQLFLLEKRFPCLSVDKYVLMPNHIHAILILDNETAGGETAGGETAGASPRPTTITISSTNPNLTGD